MTPRVAILPVLVVAFARCISSSDENQPTVPVTASFDASSGDASASGDAGAADAPSLDVAALDSSDTDVSDGSTATVGCLPLDAGGAPSCAAGGAGLSNCGAAGTECCCASPALNGGTYFRTYDPPDIIDGGVTRAPDGGPTGLADPATVSALRLDKYDVTVGRFRQFVSALLPPDGGVGWLPAAGSGKHSHLNGGQGAVSAGVASADGGVVYEPGWLAQDNVQIAPTDANLTTACSEPTFATWSSSPSGHENLPINCVNWWESYAFCIWDGGFLPTEAEWMLAASGGDEQREYPWGSAAPGTANQYAIYDMQYNAGDAAVCTGLDCIAPVGSAPLGAGRWGHLDLAGNMFQRVLDTNDSYVTPCTDCTRLQGSTYGVARGGGFDNAAVVLYSPFRSNVIPTYRSHRMGLRCARTP